MDVDKKIEAMRERLERVKLTQDMEPDALSLNLWALGAKLAALDEAGIAAESETLGIAPDDVRDMARLYSR